MEELIEQVRILFTETEREFSYSVHDLATWALNSHIITWEEYDELLKLPDAMIVFSQNPH